MADIRFEFDSKGLEQIKKLMEELDAMVQKINDTIAKTGTVTTDQAAQMKRAAVEAKKLENEKKKIELQEQRIQAAIEKQNAATKESQGIIGKLEADVKKYRSAWKSAQDEAGKNTAAEQLKRVQKELEKAKGSTNTWGNAMNSFQFKFNALGNIAANVLGGMATKLIPAVISGIKSLDSGATALEAKMKQLNVAWGVWLQTVRGQSGDGSAFKYLWEGVKAAKEYTYAMDALNDAMVANLNQERQMEYNAAKYLRLSQDRTLSDEQRAKYLEQSIEEEKRLLNLRKEYAQTAYDEELKVVGAKFRISEKLLDRFTQADAITADVMLKLNEPLRVARDNGEKDFAKLEELYVKKIELDTSYEESIKRSFGKLSGFYKELDDEKKKSYTGEVNSINELKSRLDELNDKRTKINTNDLESINIINNQIRAIQLQISAIENLNAALDEAFNEDDIEGFEWNLFDKDKLKADAKEITDQLWQAVDVQTKGLDAVEKKDQETSQRREQIASELFDKISGFASSISKLYEANKQRELSAAGDNAAKREQIERRYLKKQQALSISEAVIGGSVASVNALKLLPNPLAFVLVGLAAAQTAAEIAVIKAQKFAKGGEVGGLLHSQGGTLIEAERGEFVINRRSASKHRRLIEGINEDDQVKIMASLNMDKRLNIGRNGVDYTRKLYDLLKDQESGYETPEFYVIRKGTKTIKLRKG